MLSKRYNITSSSNDKFQWLKELSTSKGIREHLCALVYGRKLVEEVLHHHRSRIRFQVIRESHEIQGGVGDTLQLSAGLFDQVDEIGTGDGFLVVTVPQLPVWNVSTARGNFELVVPCGDPQNLGAVVRSAVAFGVDKIILTQESADPFLPKSIRASSGTSLYAPLWKGPTLVEMGLICETIPNNYCLDMKGTSLSQMKWPKPSRLILGEEGRGVPANNVPRVSIPIQKVESLNVAAAAGIALFHYSQSKG